MILTGQVNVTQKHIDTGLRGDTARCAIALALKDMGLSAIVSGPGAHIATGPNERIHALFPYTVQMWISHFDSTEWRKPVNRIRGVGAPKPFKFAFHVKITPYALLQILTNPRGKEVIQSMCGSIAAALNAAKQEAEVKEDVLALQAIRKSADSYGVTAEVFGVIDEPDPVPEPVPEPDPIPEPEPAPTPEPGVLVSV